jgi:putative endonuclease
LSRRAAERRGRRGELDAALMLMAKGYRILAQRARTPFGEIDLVAGKAGLLVIVEVKARPSRSEGLAAILPRQQGRLERAALWYASASGRTAAPIRFDLVIVRPFRLPLHVRDAWRTDPS